jgi:hypothetical protein
MRATCQRTHHHQINEKPFKIAVEMQKFVQIHPLSWEKTLKRNAFGTQEIAKYLRVDFAATESYVDGQTGRTSGRFAHAGKEETDGKDRNRQVW